MKQLGIHQLVVGAALAVGLGFSGPALVQANSYLVDNALSEAPYHNGNHNHALWMPGLESGVGNDFVFTNATGLGTFTENANGTATLIGMVVSETHPNRGWNLNVTLSGKTNNALPGSPKKELTGSSYSENGGPIDTSTWHYYGEDTNGDSTFMGNFIGVLEGKGLYEGATLYLTGFGANFQVGEGANGKEQPSWSVWMVFLGCALSQPTNTRIMLRNSPNHGDFNIDLKPSSRARNLSPSWFRSRRIRVVAISEVISCLINRAIWIDRTAQEKGPFFEMKRGPFYF